MCVSIRTALAMLVVSLSAVSLAGCVSTRLSEAWMDKSYKEGPLESVLVIGMTDNVRRRGIYEEELVSRLKDRGVRAIASIYVAPDREDLDLESIREKVRDLNVQSIIVTRLVGVEKEQYYVPGEVYTVPYDYYYGFPRYYDYVYDLAYRPGYWAEYKVVKLEINLYDAKTDKLIWSAASETIDPQSVEAVARSLSKRIIENLSRHGLVK